MRRWGVALLWAVFAGCLWVGVRALFGLVWAGDVGLFSLGYSVATITFLYESGLWTRWGDYDREDVAA